MDHVRPFIEQFVKLTDLEWQQFSAILSERTYAKDEMVLPEGRISTESFFIAEGAFRFYKMVQGSEVVTALFFTNDFMGDYQSFLTQAPSLYYIQAIRASRVYVIPRDQLYRLYSLSHTFERLGRLVAERHFLMTNKRLDSFLYETPKERYEELVRRSSKLLNEVPQYMIASYLGVSPESLSRIRGRR